MVDEEPGVVAALCESGGLRFGVNIQVDQRRSR